MSIEQLRQSSNAPLARTAGFYLAVLVFLAVVAMFAGTGLVNVVLVWFDPAIAADAATDFVHLVTFYGLILMFWLAMLSQLYRPAERVGTMRVALTIAVVGVVSDVLGGTIDPALVVLYGPVFLAAALHPSRAELISRETVLAAKDNPLMLSLVGLAVVPVGLYAARHLALQRTLTDIHTAGAAAHYVDMAMVVLSVVTLAALAATGGSSARATAWCAGLLASWLALVSWVQPTTSALEPTWSVLAILWAVAVVAAFEWSERRDATDQPMDAAADPTS